MRALIIGLPVVLMPVVVAVASQPMSDQPTVGATPLTKGQANQVSSTSLRNGYPGELPGNLDYDCDVDLADFGLMQTNFTGPYPDEGGCCLSNANCDPEEFCSNGDANCAGPGQCTPRPTGCDETWNPVCGCNGHTYSNECNAHANGVNILRTGECLEMPCTGNEDCNPDEWCAEPVGTCADLGVCRVRPGLCLAYWDPVCGCDGITYSNYCYAWLHGVNIRYYGECVTSNGCRVNAECGAGEFCDKANGDCLGEGLCTARPTICTHQWDPVCGCDGVTYSNKCYANANGQTILHTGACMPPPCLANAQCAPEDYCAKAVGLCDAPGACQERPEACLAVWDPVCGCNDRTYSNWCYAAAAGENVDYYGECTTTGLCTSNGNCGSEDYCAKPFGLCEAPSGVCTERPDFCIALWDPVCGCDNKTYSNYCYAARAGENVRYKGECSASVNTCLSDAQCDDDGGSYGGHEPRFCYKPEGECDSSAGLCMNKPDACPAVEDPVCGCDDVTYFNACYAAAAGKNLASGDACQPPP